MVLVGPFAVMSKLFVETISKLNSKGSKKGRRQRLNDFYESSGAALARSTGNKTELYLYGTLDGTVVSGTGKG